MTSDIPDWVEAFEESECEYCHKKIYWVRHVKGYKIPVDPDWRPHRLSCPYSSLWSKKKKEKKMAQSHLEDFFKVNQNDNK